MVVAYHVGTLLSRPVGRGWGWAQSEALRGLGNGSPPNRIASVGTGLRTDPQRNLDTQSVRTYNVCMNVTLSIDAQVVERARKKAASLGKSLNQVIREYLQRLAGGDDAERSIEEFNQLSGRGHSRGWRFNRNEIHDRS